jgi:hypothetical protein
MLKVYTCRSALALQSLNKIGALVVTSNIVHVSRLEFKFIVDRGICHVVPLTLRICPVRALKNIHHIKAQHFLVSPSYYQVQT